MNTKIPKAINGSLNSRPYVQGASINQTKARTGSCPTETRTSTRNGIPEDHSIVFSAVPPATVESAAPLIPINHAPERVNLRRIVFRAVRLAVVVGIISGTAAYVQTTLNTATSEHAFINAEILPLRAPISGQVVFERVFPGQAIAAGAPLFAVENARYGDQPVNAQLNWTRELAERLRTEQEEAGVRLAHQEEIFRAHQKLHADGIISDLALREEQSRRDMARTTMENRERLAIQAEARITEIRRQVELQRKELVTMPFNGTIWAAPTRSGSHIATHEKVIEVLDREQIWVEAFFHERAARKLSIGSEVDVSTAEGQIIGTGRVESIRGGVGRVPYEGVLAVSPVDYTRRRVAVRVRLNSENIFDANEFFGVGRSVVVTTRDSGE